jgi:hypothetical protein
VHKKNDEHNVTLLVPKQTPVNVQFLNIIIDPLLGLLLLDQSRKVLGKVRTRGQRILGQAGTELALGIGHFDLVCFAPSSQFVRFDKINAGRSHVDPFQSGKGLEDAGQYLGGRWTRRTDKQHIGLLRNT